MFQVSFDIFEHSTSVVYLEFENVMINKMPFLNETLLDLLHLITSDDSSSFTFDLSRMEAVIRRFAMRQLLALEKDPREISLVLIGDILYGKSFNDVSKNWNFHICYKNCPRMRCDGMNNISILSVELLNSPRRFPLFPTLGK